MSCLVVFSSKSGINVFFTLTALYTQRMYTKLGVNHKGRRGNSNRALLIGGRKSRDFPAWFSLVTRCVVKMNDQAILWDTWQWRLTFHLTYNYPKTEHYNAILVLQKFSSFFEENFGVSYIAYYRVFILQLDGIQFKVFNVLPATEILETVMAAAQFKCPAP